MSALGNIRNAVYSTIESARDSYVINTFVLCKTYYPKVELQNLQTPKVSVIPLQWEEQKLTRKSSKILELPVQVALQAKVNPTNFEQMDQLVDLYSELRDTCAVVELPGYSWLRTMGQQDPNGTPMTFAELHEQHLFQAIFTATYQAAVAVC